MNNQFLKQQGLFLIAGPCVIESEEHCLKMAGEIKKICDKLGIYYIFKASFDKANRTSINSYRGPGLEEGLRILQKVKDTYNVPILTDVHEPKHCEPTSKIADLLQVPSFMCRQTDLLVAAGKTGKIVQVKKGQFCSHITMQHCNDKIKSTGNNNILLCERGTMFGYTDLIVDIRNFPLMKQNNKNALIIYDTTHSLQQPNKSGTTGGQRHLIPYLAKAIVATGCVDGLFMEVHDNPKDALSDAAVQWPLNKLEELLIKLKKIYDVTKIEI